jgi:hypothetical protein
MSKFAACGAVRDLPFRFGEEERVDDWAPSNFRTRSDSCALEHRLRSSGLFLDSD